MGLLAWAAGGRRRRSAGASTPRTARVMPAALVPPDPAAGARPLDPSMAAIRSGLSAHRRRLWLRRVVRRAWTIATTLAIAEAALALAQRAFPIEAAPAIAVGLPVAAVGAMLMAAAMVHPSLGETALAVDAEARTGDAVASALAFAAREPVTAGKASRPDDAGTEDGASIEVGSSFDVTRAEAAFVLRQRRDALARLVSVDPGLFRPGFAARHALVASLAVLVAAIAFALPNPQDAVIARDRAIRDEARAQAQRVDQAAHQLASRAETPSDPRSKLAEEMRQFAEQLRQNPGDPQANLAKLGAVEDDIRSQLDPSSEQRASVLATVARALSRTATKDPLANPEGNTKITHEDLNALGATLDTMKADQLQATAVALASLQDLVSQADTSAGRALQDAASSLAGGDTATARTALDRLGMALEDAVRRVDQNRDIASAASQLQDARRSLADAGNPQSRDGQANTQGQGSGQQGGNQGNGQPGSSPGASGEAGGQGQGGSAAPGSSGKGQRHGGSPGASGPDHAQGPGGSPGSSLGAGQGQGQQPGQGTGQGQGQQPGGSLGAGGGGTNAAYLGAGTRSGGMAGGPAQPNRPSVLGPDLSSVYAPFDRLGRPGDPSYVAGTGGDGQLQQGDQQGQGTDNGSSVPYSQVYGDFYRYAITTLDRSYVPSSVKDYVRDYFSSLDPRQ